MHLAVSLHPAAIDCPTVCSQKGLVAVKAAAALPGKFLCAVLVVNTTAVVETYGEYGELLGRERLMMQGLIGSAWCHVARGH